MATNQIAMNVGVGALPVNVLVKIFSYCSFNDLLHSIQFVCRWWQEVSRERSLWKDMVFTPSHKMAGTQLIQILTSSPQLQALDLTDVTVDKKILTQLVDSCPNLHCLSITWDDIFTFDSPVILAKIKTLTLTLGTKLLCYFQVIDSMFPNLEHLEASALHCRKEHLDSYLKKKYQSLHTISLRCYSLSRECILKSLPLCENLKSVNVRYLCRDILRQLSGETIVLRNILCLNLQQSEVSDIGNTAAFFTVFPNITELNLYMCSGSSEVILYQIALTCQHLKKLAIHRCNEWKDESLKQIHHFQKLSHVSICDNYLITDEGIGYLQNVQELTHLDLYACDRVTVHSLKSICSFQKLQVLKFDLAYSDPPVDLTIDHVTNRNLHLMFYKCKSATSLDHLRQLHLRVTMIYNKQSILKEI